ncbi:hypothetical protein DV515_00000650 [Chloebia gouldiae]|uniref:DH domain-containing protein n=1 Tax=Chloebia gouldiae TaxID=44316 RepID=A0A3L8T082_CHLGU|nr:hypothetical protein DV515_00000650 [Chloebia gouldiae]
MRMQAVLSMRQLFTFGFEQVGLLVAPGVTGVGWPCVWLQSLHLAVVVSPDAISCSLAVLKGLYNFKYNFRDWDFLFINAPGCFALAAASSAQRAGFSPEDTTVSSRCPLLVLVNVLERELGRLCPRLAESLALPALGGRGRLASPPGNRNPTALPELPGELGMKLHQREAKPRAFCCQTRQFYCFHTHSWLLNQLKTAVFFFLPWDLVDKCQNLCKERREQQCGRRRGRDVAPPFQHQFKCLNSASKIKCGDCIICFYASIIRPIKIGSVFTKADSPNTRLLQEPVNVTEFFAPGLAPAYSGQHDTDPNPSMWVVPADGTSQQELQSISASVTGVHLALLSLLLFYFFVLFKRFPCYAVLKFHLARVSLLLTVALSEHLDAGCADLQSLDTMQPMERKRQGYIHELIQTEERYMDDLQLVVEVFQKPMADSSCLTEGEMGLIFVNWKELIMSNTKLLKKFAGFTVNISVLADYFLWMLAFRTARCSQTASKGAIIRERKK